MAEICGESGQEKRTWSIAQGEIKALRCQTVDIPKASVSLVTRQQSSEKLYRTGLNIYARHPKVPYGSFAVLLSRQADVIFIGGVIELFPAITVAEDIDMFRQLMKRVAIRHGQDYEQCRSGLAGAFRLKDTHHGLGAEAGFNFYRAGLEATHENLVFVKEVFLSALDGFKVILEKRATASVSPEEHAIKRKVWREHLRYMKEEDVGIKMSLEQGLPIDFFSFSTFPPVNAE